MIRIINTNKINLNKTNQNWRRAECSNLVDKIEIGNNPTTSQSDVDAIANMMDSQNTEEINQPIYNCSKWSKEDEMRAMVQDYIKNNGGIPLDNKKENKEKTNNKTLFG